MTDRDLEKLKMMLRMLEILREWAVDMIDADILQTARPNLTRLELLATQCFSLSAEDEFFEMDFFSDNMMSCIEIPRLTFGDICDAYERKLKARIQLYQDLPAQSQVA